MNKKNLGSGIQTFFVSNDRSQCPMVSDIIDTGKRLMNSGLFEKNTGSISIRYGKRMAITACDSNIANLEREDIIEVIDYDPTKKTALVIGTKKAGYEAALHWLIYRGREDVNAVIHIDHIILPKDQSYLQNIHVTEKELLYNSVERILAVLRILKENSYIVFGKQRTLLALDIDIERIEQKIYEELK